jgi:hypothetical protein
MPAGQTSLFVDDEMNRDMLSPRLRCKGYDVAVAHDGDEVRKPAGPHLQVGSAFATCSKTCSRICGIDADPCDTCKMWNCLTAGDRSFCGKSGY